MPRETFRPAGSTAQNAAATSPERRPQGAVPKANIAGTPMRPSTRSSLRIPGSASHEEVGAVQGRNAGIVRKLHPSTHSERALDQERVLGSDTIRVEEVVAPVEPGIGAPLTDPKRVAEAPRHRQAPTKVEISARASTSRGARLAGIGAKAETGAMSVSAAAPTRGASRGERDTHSRHRDQQQWPRTEEYGDQRHNGRGPEARAEGMGR